MPTNWPVNQSESRSTHLCPMQHLKATSARRPSQVRHRRARCPSNGGLPSVDAQCMCHLLCRSVWLCQHWPVSDSLLLLANCALSAPRAKCLPRPLFVPELLAAAAHSHCFESAPLSCTHAYSVAIQRCSHSSSGLAAASDCSPRTAAEPSAGCDGPTAEADP
jgi:hypothetical protein